ncbi:Metallo-dependent hydrolase [Trametes coccinea BRFM310]|uniref:Metallo-dependent hydrolase n=1 Tax=Trametes coccinea (strain BRFM310) TaxID=1353009 RepID=A0A1Y2J4Y5_TRAC3|nr:Metallo-dependent hydrolase [Trametes coccinea BRFM310]
MARDGSAQRRAQLIRGDFVHTPRLGEIQIMHDHLLRTDEKGNIDYFASASLPASEDIMASMHAIPVPAGAFIIPTFCDLHLHAPQFLYQGTGLHLPLMEWLNEYAFKAEERLDSDSQLAERVYKRLAYRLLEHGTGAVMLFGTIKTETNLILARVMQEVGQLRAFVGKLSMDQSSRPSYVEDSAEASLAAAHDFCDRCIEMFRSLPEHRRLVQPVLTPRFVPTCSKGLLSGLGDLAEQRGLRIQSHMAEAHDQVQHVLVEHGEADLDVFRNSNLLTPRTVQAHCTFLSSEELHEVAATGTAIAHCPLSNAYFSAEPFRLREALDAGVRVGLGTDIAGGYSVDIMNAMRQAVAVSRMREGARTVSKMRSTSPAADVDQETDDDKPVSIDWKEALYLATRGGALALDLPEGCGTFTVGAPFDAQWIELVVAERDGEAIGELEFFDDATKPGVAPLDLEMVEEWWCLGDSRNRRGVFIQGEVVGWKITRSAEFTLAGWSGEASG